MFIDILGQMRQQDKSSSEYEDKYYLLVLGCLYRIPELQKVMTHSSYSMPYSRGWVLIK